MHADSLKKLVYAEKFVPFTMHLLSGRSLEIPHPDFILLTRGGRTAVVNLEGEFIELIDVGLISSITTTDKDVAVN